MRFLIPADLIEAALPSHGVDKEQGEDRNQQPRSPPACVAAQVGKGFRGRDEDVDDARTFGEWGRIGWGGGRYGKSRSGGHKFPLGKFGGELYCGEIFTT